MTKKSVTYSLSLKGLRGRPGSISITTLRKVLDAVYEGSERALRLAIEGESVKTGPLPNWLEKSADFVLKGIRKGSTVLVFEAPTLGEVAAEQISQQDLWYTVPEPDDTAFTILARSVADIKNEKLESERYDPGVLESLLSLRDIVGDKKVVVTLSSSRASERFSLNEKSFQKMAALRYETPAARAVVVTGFLNMLKYSQRQFELRSEQGEILRGKIDETSVPLERLRPLWGKKVTVRGMLHFMASKKPRLLEAQVILPQQEGDTVFSTISLPLSTGKVMEPLKSERAREGLLSEIWGKWPGDESIEELLDALNDRPQT